MKRARVAALGGLAAVAVGAVGVQAQSVDSLLDKLVDKGVLTANEAKALREQTDKDFAKAYSAKSGMPDWVTAFKINGDFRGRWEGLYAADPAYQDNSRLRYRARLGFTAVMVNNFEAGFRLASGNLDNAFVNAGQETSPGSDPISSNQTMENNASKKGVFIDQAYMKWSGLNSARTRGALTFGKMQNPMTFSGMVFDQDYTPEGGAVQLSYQLADKHTLSVASGYFVADEVGSSSSSDAFMVNSQLTLNSTWSPRFSTMVTGGFLWLGNPETLTNPSVPNVNIGNTRKGTNGELAYEFNPFVVGGTATYTVPSAPFYRGAFPITIGAEYMLNPAAPNNDTINGVYTSTGNYSYNAGIMFGKAGKKGTWELAYLWRFLGANSWYEEVAESDFGAYLAYAQPNSGQGAGYRTGTNFKGHIVRVSYSPLDLLVFSFNWYYVRVANEALVSGPKSWDSYASRFQVDATVKF